MRHYDEVGLVVPSARSQGGFRLDGGEPLDDGRRQALTATLRRFEQAAQQRCDELRTQLERAEEFAGALRRRLDAAEPR
ncbi:hypothetical protein ORI60_23985 [Lentzea sp. NEAU-D7]|nr:hypothetical protein [Lentzea sp. NEAU-D7]